MMLFNTYTIIQVILYRTEKLMHSAKNSKPKQICSTVLKQAKKMKYSVGPVDTYVCL